jgi:hypothetical protein
MVENRYWLTWPRGWCEPSGKVKKSNGDGDDSSAEQSGFERFVAEGGMPGAKQATLRRLMRTASL